MLNTVEHLKNLKWVVLYAKSSFFKFSCPLNNEFEKWSEHKVFHDETPSLMLENPPCLQIVSSIQAAWSEKFQSLYSKKSVANYTFWFHNLWPCQL
jgi:hypothetical protein